MNILRYYFLLEFGWKKDVGWTDKGFPRIQIRPTEEFVSQYGYINYEIMDSVFLSDSRMQNANYVADKIKQIENVILGKIEILTIFNEVVALEIKKDFSRPIDNLGDTQGLEAPLSWNISTPNDLQYVPTKEVLQIFKDWLSFISELEKMVLIKS